MGDFGGLQNEIKILFFGGLTIFAIVCVAIGYALKGCV